MATTPTQTHTLDHSPLNLSFNADTDFTVLADYCERFADSLIASAKPGERRVLCYRLAECLELLYSTLNDDIPEHLIESFTVDSIPAQVPTFEPDPDDLCRYCLTLANILNSHNFSAMEEKALTGLLFELTGHFADELRTPRFVRTAITM
ncbi:MULTISPECIES: hypothetical protein [Buttiauxella]|uniref:Uncharacterized protein n=1 Tax=Buttiauxella ferragutiae ATCC 51602 TaxID=1354252 RepID=A0ABX2WB56_9ENTR|nr:MULTISPECIES: hypothetical protein [Buttiauxella]OAT30032.1 hypothetical protein M976_01152 [Buttiauxella ferragutiae ATCC 51602]